MTDVSRYRTDDLRRFASSLAAALGVHPARASSLASHFLWFDEAGAPTHGLSRLPELLDRIEVGAVDPKAEGAVSLERNGTAVFDACHGVPLLALIRAGGIATEKARDAGVGVVTVRNLGEAGAASVVVAEMAIGPAAAVLLGPGPSWSVALPGPEGLPAVFDPALATETRDTTGRKEIETLIGPWASVFAPKEGCLVAALSVPAIEPLSAFHDRVAGAIEGLDETSGRLIPALWEARRREARARGVVLGDPAWTGLRRWAERAGVELPVPTES